MGSIELVGHRGAPKELYENTLEAFQRAFERGADAIELDVHASRDAVVVVHHDPSLRKGTEPTQWIGRPLAEMTADEIRRVRLPGGAGIPTLAEVLAEMPGEAIAYVELKGAAIESLTTAVIRSSKRRCAVHSFDHSAVERAAKIAPEIPRGLLFDQYPRDLSGSMERAGATSLWLERRLPDQQLVDAAHQMGARVYAWTVNEPSEARHLAELGVDALCSDDLRPLSFLR